MRVPSQSARDRERRGSHIGELMRKLIGLLVVAVACAVVAPSTPGRAAGRRPAAPAWPPLSNNVQWLMVEDEPMLDIPGGAAQVLEICRRAKATGYNGLILWDSHLWERQLPPGYLENAEMLKRGLH